MGAVDEAPGMKDGLSMDGVLDCCVEMTGVDDEDAWTAVEVSDEGAITWEVAAGADADEDDVYAAIAGADNEEEVYTVAAGVDDMDEAVDVVGNSGGVMEGSASSNSTSSSSPMLRSAEQNIC